MAMAYNFDALLHLLCDNNEAVQEQVEAAMRLTTQHELYQWQWTAAILQRWHPACQHDHREEHLSEFQQAVTSYRQQGALYLEWFLALQAQVFGYYGQPETEPALLSEAFEIIECKEEASIWQSELYRLKGTLLLARSEGHQSEAEACLHQAIDIARHRQAKSWELRATTSLSRLWIQPSE